MKATKNLITLLLLGSIMPAFAVDGVNPEVVARIEQANQGAEALAQLGWIYYSGQHFGVQQDYVQAREYFEHAAAQTFNRKVQARAWFMLGEIYHSEGVQQSYDRARHYYIQAVEQTVSVFAQAGAYLGLGRMYHHGHGVQQDLARAKYYYMQAAAQDVNTFARDEAIEALELF